MALAIGVIPFVWDEPMLWTLPLGILFGVFMDPDLDLPGKTMSEARMRQVNPVLGQLWYWFWWPYAKMSHHRGISHVPVLGTGIRVVYLLWVPLLLYVILLAGSVSMYPEFVVVMIGLAVSAFTGLCIADGVHIAYDYIASGGDA